MKKVLFFAIPVLVLLSMACSKEKIDPVINQPAPNETQADLTFLREEEKLARDVYRYAARRYPSMPIFGNIASSEQTHMDKTLAILQHYSLPDPVGNNAEGVFVDTLLQQLYVQLTQKVDLSLVDALQVGATIEDLDIADIMTNQAVTDLPDDIALLYAQLHCGSRNHLRAYVGQINTQGSSYAPQYLTASYYAEVLAGSHENCNQP
jgi:hypothetical protein